MIAVDDIEIRPISELSGMHAVEALQRTVWGMPERDVVPYHQLLAAVNAGGIVLGAFAAERLIGFCYGFVGLRTGRLLFYSHMTGVQEEYRGSEIGFRLKRAQRQVALNRGIDHMVWTFDPLMSVNAYFNMHKLGTVARRYYVNYYGEMPDALNRGIESDRLEVDWWLRGPRIESLMRGEHRPQVWHDMTPIIVPVPRSGGPAPGDPVFDLTMPVLRLEIPTTFTQMKNHDAGLARAWRMATRECFLHYFRRGYAVVDFVLEGSGADRRGAYVLQHQPDIGPRPSQAVMGVP